jgi:Matrixin/Clostridial hydrophobic W/Putative peptidoglycan binding domain
MAQNGMKRFTIGVRNLPPDSHHDELPKVQRYLVRYGYLRGPYERGRLDAATQQALLLFQTRMNLAPVGALDDDTVAALETHRCGTPDLFPARRSSSGEFVLRGCSYQSIFRTLTYAFVLGTPDLPGSGEKQAVRDAFVTWQQEIPLDFAEVDSVNNPNFRIGWFTGDHGDGSAFDGVGNVLAHAFYPPPCGGTHAGACHFDDDEVWALAHGAGQFDTQTVALHEIGHLLGLSHSTVPGAVMFPTYAGARRALAQDDIDGIRALYGRRGVGLDGLVHLEGIADQGFRENEFSGTRGQSRRLEGFQLQISPAVGGLSMRYMAHLQDVGDVPFVNEGQFIGTRGQSRRLEGFAIELTGPAANNFRVRYMAHLQGTGDTGIFENGQFCGTRGQSRRVEGILVRVEPN